MCKSDNGQRPAARLGVRPLPTCSGSFDVLLLHGALVRRQRRSVDDLPRKRRVLWAAPAPPPHHSARLRNPRSCLRQSRPARTAGHPPSGRHQPPLAQTTPRRLHPSPRPRRHDPGRWPQQRQGPCPRGSAPRAKLSGNAGSEPGAPPAACSPTSRRRTYRKMGRR